MKNLQALFDTPVPDEAISDRLFNFIMFAPESTLDAYRERLGLPRWSYPRSFSGYRRRKEPKKKR